ncbi:hypothetical protein BGX28_003443 [Mortierella sp. GBA30]|nr:hypothetical protein BGX28_003443 [Mortierella sp. GBA30]
MGTYNHGISSGSAQSSLSHLHRSSLKPASHVRWPVNLNQLAAISLDDDSDLDRSLTDRSVKLLKMLKDSDDETTVIPRTGTRLRSRVLGEDSRASRASGPRSHQPDMTLTMGVGKTQNRTTTSKNMEEMERISSHAGSVTQTLGNIITVDARANNTGIQGPRARIGSSSVLRKPAVASSAAQQPKARHMTTTRKRLASTSQSSRNVQRTLPASSTVGSNPVTAHGARVPTGLQQPSSTPQPLSNTQQQREAAEGEGRIVVGPLNQTLSIAVNESESNLILELTEELERWKSEAQEYQKEHIAVENWRKQITDLERDLGTALESLQAAEAKVIKAQAEHEAKGSQVLEYVKTIEKLRTDLDSAKTEKERKEKALEEESSKQTQKLGELESRNQELEKKLTQAQSEIEQLELQVVPAELQDVHQALFSATQELEEMNRLKDKLTIDLADEKEKVIREQQDSGQLLVKLSQLQDNIANQLRDINALKDTVKEHEKCQENAEAVEYQHKKVVELLQTDIATHQQTMAQEKEFKAILEQALQEQQYQNQQLQQQLQMQQTQLVQQQTEIVNLRASLEVEQKQVTLLQQRLHEEQRLNNPQFGRRVSLDGELNGSFLMIETSRGGIQPGTVPAMGSNTELSVMTSGMANMPVKSFAGSGPGPLSPLTPSSMLTSQIASMSASSPSLATISTPTSLSGGGMVAAAGAATGSQEIEPKPRMIQRGSSGSIASILSSSAGGNSNHTVAKRLSIHGDMVGSFGGGGASLSSSSSLQAAASIEELTVQLQSLMKEKERLQADLSKIPISGGGPMTRRKAEMLEEQMDETERTMSKIRYSIRMRS